jgi:hypothetical protein
VPTHIRAMCQWQVGSGLPEDVMQITPCFRAQADWDPLGGTDWDSLAQDLVTALEGWTFQDRKLTVKLYDIDEAAPGHINRPKATKVSTNVMTHEQSFPRELSLCLSFYGGTNQKRERGRLYVPYWLISGDDPGVRPSDANLAYVAGLVPIFANLGGTNVDWIVWSTTGDKATKVTNAYVDDEWDTQRRRGLRPTKRHAVTTSG